MEVSQRTNLAAKSATAANKKLANILANREAFVKQVDRARQEMTGKAAPFLRSDEGKLVEGRDMDVCVRVRPMLNYEQEAGYFETILAANPKVLSLDPRLGVRGDPRPVRSDFGVDFAFGPDHDNDQVYSAVTMPLIDLGLKGGVCTMLAYGQTGSGKTHTIGGVLQRMAKDLFERQQLNKQLVDEHGQSCVKLFLSFYELLGNDACDLLDGQRGKVDIMEDKFGKIVIKNATEAEVDSPARFAELCASALAHRRTETTFKNDSSSRSHAVCSVRVVNSILKEAEDGRIFVIDLAGSESAADSQFHDRSLVRETQLINKSLMALKDCIRNRALSAADPGRYYHVPYRLSRLTLLLKDAFEVESRRHCKTVVIACVSPSCADVSMTMNTLRYAAPIRIGQLNREKVEEDPDNPACWSNADLRKWVEAKSGGKVDPEVLCPHESGMQLLRVPETEFLRRVMDGAPGFGEKRAKAFYTSLWKLLIDARTKERKMKLKKKRPPLVDREESLGWLRELNEKGAAEMNRKRDEEYQRRTTEKVNALEANGRRLQVALGIKQQMMME